MYIYWTEKSTDFIDYSFCFALFLPSYVMCLFISSFALSTRQPPPCPRDLPHAPHFPPPLFASISFRRVKDSEEIEKDLPMLPSRKTNEGKNGRECERQETGKETVVHPIREYARIKRARSFPLQRALSPFLSDKITLKPRTSRVNYNCTLDLRKMVVQYRVTETRRILP